MTITMPKNMMMLAATLILALGVTSTVQVNNAQAHHRDGRVIAGVIAGAALLAIIASKKRKKHRRYHRRHHYYDYGYDRRYYGRPHRKHRRFRRHRRDYW